MDENKRNQDKIVRQTSIDVNDIISHQKKRHCKLNKIT